MDDLSANRARELIAAGRSQRTAALELGVSRRALDAEITAAS
jgi:predicted transcriptional regulator